MKILPLLVLAAVLSGGAGAVAALSFAPSSDNAPDPVETLAADLERTEMRSRLDALDRSQKELAQAIQELRSDLSTSSGSSRVSMSEIEDLVARALANAEPTALQPEAVELAESEELDAAAIARMILEDQIPYDEQQAMWEKLREAGKLEEAVAWFEQHAEANPNDANAQVDLGNAYLQKLMTLPDGPAKGMWATKADQVFDKALELDDHHWEGRFAKAVSLSFWPPVFGKQQEAINHFETLIGQQQEGPPQPQHSQTYLLLGNMYSQMGQIDQAVATWNNGLTSHPGDEALQEQIDAFSQNQN